MKNIYKKQLDWIRKNPVFAAYLAFFKGIIFTVLFYEFILK